MTPDPGFEEGDVVRIKSGPFNAFTGRVREVDESRFVLKVLVSIFGRSQPVELGFTDVEKLSFTEEE
jgi:transcriptional antiterminator NusG